MKVAHLTQGHGEGFEHEAEMVAVEEVPAKDRNSMSYGKGNRKKINSLLYVIPKIVNIFLQQ